MPKIRTYTVGYTISTNRHTMDVNIMYDTGKKTFYVAIPESFKDAINTMPEEFKEQWNVKNAIGIRGICGLAIIHDQETELINKLEDLFYYCGSAIKKVRKVIVVWSGGISTANADKHRHMGSNKERIEISQKFKFVLAIETKVGDGEAIYTYQGVTYTNTISMSDYNGKPIVIDDTDENRVFLEVFYNKFDGLIITLQKFFENSDTVLQLIASNQKLLN
jgi:hypothetical protein